MATDEPLASLRPHAVFRPITAGLSSRALAIAALLVATVLWGASFVAAKPVVGAVPPATLACLRLVIAGAVLLPILRLTGRRPTLGRDAALFGLAGVTFVFLLQNAGLRATSAANATLVMTGGYAVITAVLARVALGERLRGRVVLGVAASVGGVVVVVLAGPAGGVTLSPRGDLLVLGAAACAAAGTVTCRRAFATGDALAIVTGASLYGLVVLLPVAAWEQSRKLMALPSADQWLAIAFLGVACSAVAFALWGIGLRQLSASESAMVGNLEPAVGVAAAVLLLGEHLASLQITGSVLILAALWLGLCADGTAKQHADHSVSRSRGSHGRGRMRMGCRMQPPTATSLPFGTSEVIASTRRTP